MIRPSIFNGIDFSDDFNRENKFYETTLQRVENIISPITGGYLSFEYLPDEMPDPIPGATMYFCDEHGTVLYSQPANAPTELTDRVLYFCHMNVVPSDVDYMYFKIDDTDKIVYSEKVVFVAAADLASKNVCKIVAYNNDDRYGYVSTYPAFGFFEFSELNSKVFGSDKVEYVFGYGRKKILSSENYIKTRLTFMELSIGQQNALKILCNLQNLSINGVNYYLVSDFTEINKDPQNEICDLQAEFVKADQSFFQTGASKLPTELKIKNLFTK